MLSKFANNMSRPLARQFSQYMPEESASDIFSDTRGHGFLPRVKPIAVLPREFNDLEEILQKMVIIQPDGSKGLLGKNILRQTVDADFPDLTE